MNCTWTVHYAIICAFISLQTVENSAKMTLYVLTCDNLLFRPTLYIYESIRNLSCLGANNPN